MQQQFMNISAEDEYFRSARDTILFLCEEASESHIAAERGQKVVGSEYPFDLIWLDDRSVFSQQKFLLNCGKEV
jgi:hypothetical protein